MTRLVLVALITALTSLGSSLPVTSPARAQTDAAASTAQESREATKPIFSRDGRQVAYTELIKSGAKQTTTKKELWIVNVDGTDPRRLTEGLEDDNPSFSPNGQQLVFARDGDLWTIGTDGAGLRNVTNTTEAEESAAEFSNDGLSLVFLRRGPGGFEQSVVLRSLETGDEHVLLGNGYRVTQVVPNYRDDNTFFILCAPLDQENKPVKEATLDKIIAVLKRDGSPPRMALQLKPGSKYRILRMHITPERNFVEVEDPDNFTYSFGIFQDGEVDVLPDTPLFGDVSPDGNTIVGIDVVDSNKRSLGLVLYDVATRQSKPLREPNAIPFLAQKHFDAGTNHYYEDKYAEAIAEFTKAIELYPQYAEAYHQRGWMHHLNENEKSALSDLAEAIRIDPNLAGAYLTRALIHDANDRIEAALADYTAAIRIDPKNDTPYEERGMIYVRQNKLNLAAADFTEAIKIRPNNLTALLGRGDIRAGRGDTAGALQDYAAAIKHFPTYSDVYRKRAKLYRATGKTALAIADEKKFKELEAKR